MTSFGYGIAVKLDGSRAVGSDSHNTVREGRGCAIGDEW